MARSPSSPLADTAAPERADLHPEAGLQDLKAEQALAWIGMGLMRKLMAEGDANSWLWAG